MFSYIDASHLLFGNLLAGWVILCNQCALNAEAALGFGSSDQIYNCGIAVQRLAPPCPKIRSNSNLVWSKYSYALIVRGLSILITKGIFP